MLIAAVFVAALWGYRHSGLDGACEFAAAVWVGGAIFAWMLSRKTEQMIAAFVENVTTSVAALKDEVQALRNYLPPSQRFYEGVLDSLPTETYQKVHLPEPRTLQDWEAVSPLLWTVRRRRLVHGWGLSADRVDKLRRDLETDEICGGPPPRSNADLITMVKRLRESEAEAWAEAAKSRVQAEGKTITP